MVGNGLGVEAGLGVVDGVESLVGAGAGVAWCAEALGDTVAVAAAFAGGRRPIWVPATVSASTTTIDAPLASGRRRTARTVLRRAVWAADSPVSITSPAPVPPGRNSIKPSLASSGTVPPRRWRARILPRPGKVGGLRDVGAAGSILDASPGAPSPRGRDHPTGRESH